jgi:hypothetical protein
MAATVATPLERALGRIAGITEITSTSTLGSTRVVLQFELSRNIDGAAREVQAAINAARAMLPTSLPNNPTYRKANPADAPVVILALTSDTFGQGRMYDYAQTVLAQKLSQLKGVGQVDIGGSSLPAVRVEIDFPLDDRKDIPRGPLGPTRLELDKPVIAAVAGPAVAGGFELALWCDVRVMEESAYFGVYCRRWGVPLRTEPASFAGSSRRLRRLGAARLRDVARISRSSPRPRDY